MFLAEMISWWYSLGWLNYVNNIKRRLQASADFFSIGLLASTLFAPFRQISADSIQGTIGVKIQAFFDRLLSRFIGATMRLFTMVFGIIVILVQFLFCVLAAILWFLIPLAPVAGLVMMIIGWVPTWLS